MGLLFKSILLFLIFAQCSYGFIHFGHIMKDLLEDYHLKLLIYNHTSNSIKSCPHYDQDIQKAAKEADACLDGYKLDEKAFCRFMRNDFRRCMHPFKSILEKCLPSRNREMPKFIIDTIIALANFACKSSGEKLFELTNPCIQAVFESNNQCLTKIGERLEQARETFPTKEEVCSTANEFKVCLKKELIEQCASSVTREAALRLFDATFYDCYPHLKHPLHTL